MNTAIRVLIADDHTIVRKGISALLATEPGIEVVGEAGDGREAVAQAERLHPEIVLMDLVMPELDGIEAIKRVTANPAPPRIIVLSSFATNEKIFPALKAGALGYLLKDSSPEELIQAIRQVHGGESWLHPAIARRVLQELSGQEPAPSIPSPDTLTDREVEVLKLLAQGHSNREITERLVISEATVRTHVSSILSKLHLANRTQAALYALRGGIVQLEEGVKAREEA